MREAFRAIIVSAVLTSAALAAASNRMPFTAVSVDDAQRQLGGLEQVTTGVTFYVWSNKYVYQPGESLTLRWTLATNNDLYPYTVFGYRQNNQTGAKTFLPNGTADPTDIFGNTGAQGFRIVRLADTSKQVLLGDGGLLGGTVTIPNELGMHTLVVELRDFTGGRVLKAAYMKIGVVDGFETISGNIESSRTLVNTKAYRLSGAVFVRNNAVLTIDPGTFVIGQPGSQPPSVLVVTRNGRIAANGTKSRPIVMTAAQDFGQRQRGAWGGLILLGKAPINVGANSGGQTNTAGEFNIEGLPASEDTRYGGSDPNHDCGSLRYVRVEYAGSIFAPNNEANSFTWGGCGKQTVADHLQAIYGLDDSFEWFGGTMDAKYLVGGLSADDYVDYQLGWVGRLQFGVFYQNSDNRGNRGVEGDNSEYNQSATPRSKPTMYNLTFIGSGAAGFDEANSPGIFLRRGAAGTINNVLATNFFSTGVFATDQTTQDQIDSNELTMNGILLWNNGVGSNPPAGNTVAGQVDSAVRTFAEGTRGTGRNFVAADPMLRAPFAWSAPDFRPKEGSVVFRAGWVAPPDDGFFDQSAKFIGAFGDEDWTEEWTSFLQDADIQ